MDFKNLCSRLDMDSIRARLPHLPALPPMPHVKMPKSMSKLKSRKIFRSSRENVNKASSPKQSPTAAAMATTLASTSSVAPPMQQADFINRTPTRISTITSLMQPTTTGGGRFGRHDSSTYRSADSFDDDDDDYPSPPGGPSNAHGLRGPGYKDHDLRGHSNDHELRRPGFNNHELSPRNTPPAVAASVDSPEGAGSRGNVKMSLGERLQKGYRDFADFRFKHILAKRTVVRKSNIEVDHYVERYEADRVVEEAEETRRDREIADDYTFRFKESRQNTGRSNSISPIDDSPPMTKAFPTKRRTPPPPPPPPAQHPAESAKVGKSESGDESGMETTPPNRGVASSRFAITRHQRLGVSEDSSLDDGGDEPPEPQTSSLWAIKEQAPREAAKNEAPAGRKGYKERIRRLTNYKSSHDDDDDESDDDETGSDGEKKQGAKQRKRRKARPGEESGIKSKQSLNERSDKPLAAIKQNLKRFKTTMSMKRQPTTDANESDEGEKVDTSIHAPSPTAREKLAARLRRFKSHEASSMEEEDKKPGSPLHAALTNKLQTWKKSFKKKPNESGGGDGTGDEASPQKGPSRPSTLIKKLKYIRKRKNPNSDEDEDHDQENDESAKTKEGGGRRTKQFEEKLEHARRRTMKKVNDRMQKMKIFHKSHENVEKKTEGEEDGEGDLGTPTTSSRPPAPVRPVDSPDDQFSSDQDPDEDIEDIEEINTEQHGGNYEATQKIHAVWTTRPILSDSTESEDEAVEYPRVLIHQDNSDLFESTLIIAVTTAAASSSPGPKIVEISARDTALRTSPTPNATRAVEWIPNSEIVSNFLGMTPPNQRRRSAADDESTPMSRGHRRKNSEDSNSDSDSWIPENARTRALNKEAPRHSSDMRLSSVQENEEAWQVRQPCVQAEDKNKSKSIDIFEAHAKGDGVQGAFEDFDDQLRNEPVMRIASNNGSEDGSFEKDSSEDAADDDNSSRVTRIRVEHIQEEEDEEVVLVSRRSSPNPGASRDGGGTSSRHQIGNSRESLDANYDDTEDLYSDEGEGDEDEESVGDDRPPSAAPSPPPSVSPPPPPLPQRQPSMRLAKHQAGVVDSPPAVLPPLPSMKPPPPPPSKPPPPPSKPPPRIPERTESMARIARPLVKTSSLRLAYTEQVKPADVGKVNKLISRFEHPPTGSEQEKGTRLPSATRPRVLRRTVTRDDSADFSSDGGGGGGGHCSEDSEGRETTLTPTNRFHQESLDSEEGDDDDEELLRAPPKRVAPMPDQKPMKTLMNEVDEENNRVEAEEPSRPRRTSHPKELPTIPKVTMDLVNKYNNNNTNNTSQSRSNSEYGSTETTPTPGRKEQGLRTPGRRQRSSMARDDDQFFSFDSDEENSYYSVSSTGSRYVVEI